MKYFTPELMEQLDSPDPTTADAADAEWDRRQEEYEQHLHAIEPDLPEQLREFTGLLLHDARVENIAGQGDKLIMVMRRAIPPRDLVIVTYSLLSDPMIDREALPPSRRSPVMEYLYNEFDLIRGNGAAQYVESILFSNGWEMQLRFRDVRVTLAVPLYPVADSVSSGSMALAYPSV
jgi:hypothetical protein